MKTNLYVIENIIRGISICCDSKVNIEVKSNGGKSHARPQQTNPKQNPNE